MAHNMRTSAISSLSAMPSSAKRRRNVASLIAIVETIAEAVQLASGEDNMRRRTNALVRED